jgi:hypothetical protein
VHAAIARLRCEPVIGPGTANRIIRELLATAAYRRVGNLMVGAGPRGRYGKPVKGTGDAA